MRLRLTNINLLLPLALATLITACGSDSTSNSTDAGTNPPQADYSFNSIVQLDETQNINQSIDLLLYYPNDIVSNIRWQQTAGNPLTVLAKTSKVISFTPTTSGNYSFSVSFSLNGNVEQTLSKDITVSDSYHKLTARLSHAVLADNKVSYRSEIQDGMNKSSLVWQQTSGPDVTLTGENGDGELALFFDAPSVEQDTIITFTVSATDSNSDTTYSDQVAVLVEPALPISNNAYFSDRKSAVFAYNANSPYAEDLVKCVYSNSLSSSCTLRKTPLLAEEVKGSSIAPSVEDIMDRVVISHQWMGDRFKEFLTNNDNNDDIKMLLRATTAIVIAYDVRPSFYWAATGAIYLDAENFWLTPQERDTINEAPDFRAAFGNDLQFVMPWRYVKNNDYASTSYRKTSRVSRTAEDALYRLTSLMYHELAHANDFFPSNEWYVHNSNSRVLDAAVSTNFESDQLTIALPLASQEMRDLGQVSFAGETANETQKNYLPVDIVEFFSPDRATDFYAYSSEREDYAMLFEELMMQSRFGIMRDVGITNQPTSDTDYIVTWGQRGRIGDNKLRERVLFSASRVLPEFNSQEAMALVLAPIEMVEGNSWFENLTISPEPALNRLKSYTRPSSLREASPININNLEENDFIRYYQKPLPKH